MHDYTLLEQLGALLAGITALIVGIGTPVGIFLWKTKDQDFDTWPSDEE